MRRPMQRDAAKVDPDVTSDPANDDKDDHGWASEGGATETGPATNAPSSDE